MFRLIVSSIVVITFLFALTLAAQQAPKDSDVSVSPMVGEVIALGAGACGRLETPAGEPAATRMTVQRLTLRVAAGLPASAILRIRVAWSDANDHAILLS